MLPVRYQYAVPVRILQDKSLNFENSIFICNSQYIPRYLYGTVTNILLVPVPLPFFREKMLIKNCTGTSESLKKGSIFAMYRYRYTVHNKAYGT